jgi:uncharacterized membrane protein YdbT with pleckstrin-like domain
METNVNYVDSNLIKDEVVKYRAGLHGIAMFWYVAIAALLGIGGIPLALAGLFSSDKGMGAAVGFGVGEIIVAAILLGFGILHIRSADFAVTNKRVILKYGLIRTRTVELFLNKIESIGVNQNIIARMLDYGTITVRGTGGTLEPFKKVAHSLEFRRQVQEQVSNLSSAA